MVIPLITYSRGLEGRARKATENGEGEERATGKAPLVFFLVFENGLVHRCLPHTALRCVSFAPSSLLYSYHLIIALFIIVVQAFFVAMKQIALVQAGKDIDPDLLSDDCPLPDMVRANYPPFVIYSFQLYYRSSYIERMVSGQSLVLTDDDICDVSTCIQTQCLLLPCRLVLQTKNPTHQTQDPHSPAIYLYTPLPLDNPLCNTPLPFHRHFLSNVLLRGLHYTDRVTPHNQAHRTADGCFSHSCDLGSGKRCTRSPGSCRWPRGGGRGKCCSGGGRSSGHQR